MTDDATLDHGQQQQGSFRETCTLCGMVANLDPWLHAQRYGHEPVVTRGGIAYAHDGAGTFTNKIP
ncbi:Uncharacterised protein [Mycobacteroides abscessus subsp. abscessus]|jgi:hypothetical protein|uniref:hypothetical protein n=1 Tax=Mycobacteroides abscessus TaxID=36809 RepID=UPI00092C3C6E|nr:hypothetical protein [Mycobacteroides abscessus]SIH23057.1 Uncharacterised protein [Mycobacteroides abscessus subsp. abscessus]